MNMGYKIVFISDADFAQLQSQVIAHATAEEKADYRVVHIYKADETVKKSATAYFYEMQSTEMRLANNGDYAARADKYNDAIRGLPASLLSPGRKPAATFS
jgi:hypothetical protein